MNDVLRTVGVVFIVGLLTAAVFGIRCAYSPSEMRRENHRAEVVERLHAEREKGSDSGAFSGRALFCDGEKGTISGSVSGTISGSDVSGSFSGWIKWEPYGSLYPINGTFSGTISNGILSGTLSGTTQNGSENQRDENQR